MAANLILASSSPRRRELLRHIGLPFEVIPSNVDETPVPGMPPAELAVYLAQAKARDSAARHPAATVIGADTLIEFQGAVINKPIDAEDAVQMLSRLCGTTHIVHSGIAVCRDGTCRTALVSSTVTMHASDEAQIRAYVATGEPLDKAGAYAAQGAGAELIAAVAGSYLAVVGLPLLALRELLLSYGVQVPAAVSALEALERGAPSN